MTKAEIETNKKIEKYADKISKQIKVPIDDDLKKKIDYYAKMTVWWCNHGHKRHDDARKRLLKEINTPEVIMKRSMNELLKPCE